MLRVLRALSPEHRALSWASRRALEDAVGAARRGDRERALAGIDEALAHDPDVPAARVIAAQVRYALGQYQRALDELDRAAIRGAEPHVDELRYRLLTQLGWNQEVREVVERRLADAPRDRVWLGRAAHLYGQLRHDEAALSSLERLLDVSPPSAALELNAAELLARTGAFERARDHALKATRLEPDRGALRAAAAVILAEGGRYREALEQAEKAEALAGAAPTAALRARLALWAGRLEDAEAHVGRALERDPELAEAHRSRGVVAVLRGAHPAALGDLERAIALDPDDPEAHVWCAEVLLRLGRFEEATASVDRALARTGRHLLGAQIVRLLAVLGEEAGMGDRLLAPSFGELRDGCEEVEPGSLAVFAAGDREAVRDLLERVLARLGGNRGERPTWLPSPGADPVPLRARTGARFASRRALDLIRVAPPDEVLRRLDEVEVRFEDSSLPAAHRGEANIWLGRYDEGLSDLERALSINAHTRWAYIGMTAIELCRGRPEAALEVSALGVERMGSTGPAVYVHRGEAYRLLGRLDEAIADLETALAVNPERLSATFDLTLVWHARGDADRAAAGYRELVRVAPGLLSDAALAIDVDDWASRALDAETRAAVLESAIRLMRGNRSSSCHTYVTDRGALRTVPLEAARRSPRRAQEDVALGHAALWLERQRSANETRAVAERGPPRCDVELVALRAGLRRAVRVTVRPEDVGAAKERYEADGLACVVAPITGDYVGGEHAILFAARTEADAREALDLELRDDAIALGRLLGYPACCTEAFDRRPDAKHVFGAACAAWVERPRARLNNLLYGIGARFVSFEPCRYDCPNALEVADAIARAVDAADPRYRAFCDETLAQAVLIDANGAHVLVALEGGAITEATPVPTVVGQPITEDAEALAARAVGARVRRDGSVEIEWPAPTLVVDFR